jgi:hypothetical protein
MTVEKNADATINGNSAISLPTTAAVNWRPVEAPTTTVPAGRPQRMTRTGAPASESAMIVASEPSSHAMAKADAPSGQALLRRPLRQACPPAWAPARGGFAKLADWTSRTWDVAITALCGQIHAGQRVPDAVQREPPDLIRGEPCTADPGPVETPEFLKVPVLQRIGIWPSKGRVNALVALRCARDTRPLAPRTLVGQGARELSCHNA